MPSDLTQDPLYDFFPDHLLRKVRVQIRVPDRVCDECCNRQAALGFARTRRSPDARGLIKIGSNPDENTIVLHPDYYKEGTASGEALRGHEMVHVQQREEIPDFERLFHEEAVRIEALGLKPWENKFERPAYEAERIMRDELLARGYPL